MSNITSVMEQTAGVAHRNESVTVGAFITSLSLSILVLFVALVVFWCLKDRDFLTYQPRSIDDGVDPLPLHLWACLRLLLCTPRQGIRDSSGLDADLFVHFLGGTALYCAMATVFLCPILLPWNVLASQDGYGVSGLSLLAWNGTQTAAGYLWMHTVVTILLASAFPWVVRRACREAIQLRDEALWSTSAQSVCVVLLCPSSPISTEVWQVFDRLGSGLRLATGKQRLLEQEARRRLEHARDDLEATLSTILAECVKTQHRKYSRNEKRIRHALSEFHTQRRAWHLASDMKGETETESTNDTMKSTVILQYHDRLSAFLAAQTVHFQESPGTIRRVCSPPDDIDWRNITVGHRSASRRLHTTHVLLVVLVVLWTIPIALAGSLAQLPTLATLIPGLEALNRLPAPVLGPIQAVLPSLFVSLVIELFDPTLRWIVARRGILSLKETELAVQRYNFAFGFVQRVLNVSIASGLTAAIGQILANPNNILVVLATNFPKASNYHLNHVPYVAALTAARHLMPLRAFFTSVTRLLQAPTPRRKQQQRQVRDVWHWGTLLPAYANLSCVVLIFTPIAPLILPIGTVAFTIMWLVYRYYFLFVGRGRGYGYGELYLQVLSQQFWGMYCQLGCMVGLLVCSQGDSDASYDDLVVHVVLRLACLLGAAISHRSLRSMCRNRLYRVPLPPPNKVGSSSGGNSWMQQSPDKLDTIILPGDDLGLGKELGRWITTSSDPAFEVQISSHDRLDLNGHMIVRSSSGNSKPLRFGVQEDTTEWWRWCVSRTLRAKKAA